MLLSGGTTEKIPSGPVREGGRYTFSTVHAGALRINKSPVEALVNAYLTKFTESESDIMNLVMAGLVRVIGVLLLI